MASAQRFHGESDIRRQEEKEGLAVDSAGEGDGMGRHEKGVRIRTQALSQLHVRRKAGADSGDTYIPSLPLVSLSCSS
jgi:hypothetical protein